MAKIDPAQKSAHMAAIGLDYAVIQSAQKSVHDLEVQAAPRIKDVVASFGPGPHKMSVPTGTAGLDGMPTTTDKIVTFRKAGDVWNIAAIDAGSIT